MSQVGHWCISNILWNLSITRKKVSQSIILGQIPGLSVNVPHGTQVHSPHSYPWKISPDYLEICQIRTSVRGKKIMNYGLWKILARTTLIIHMYDWSMKPSHRVLKRSRDVCNHNDFECRTHKTHPWMSVPTRFFRSKTILGCHGKSTENSKFGFLLPFAKIEVVQSQSFLSLAWNSEKGWRAKGTFLFAHSVVPLAALYFRLCVCIWFPHNVSLHLHAQRVEENEQRRKIIAEKI